uniref:Homologous recombination OB-fold protein OB-fold domain-containing protein n=1 Tax=Tanacetum cinerariifolium TaxID=118510 RepID=A0A6L2JVS6_TANCI|nr:hypothetical protein [Tanacetum cinerariifolium]
MSRTHKLKRLYKVGLTAIVISSFDDEALDKEDTSKQGRIDETYADKDIALVSTHDTQDNIVQDEGIEDVGEEEVVKVVTTAKMIVDDAQVNTAIADVPVSATETIVTIAPTISTESTKTNVEKRRKFFTAKRTEETRNRPPTKAQQRSLMCIYLKNIDGWKTRALKNKSFAEIQELFDKVMKRINNFVDFRTELVEKSTKKAQSEITQEESSKRAGDELEQERSKKQKVEDDKESEELKKCLEIIPGDGDDVTIDATPLSTNKMLKNFDREDLEVLWRLVKDRFVKTMPVDHMDSFLMNNLKTMFEHHVKDNVWKNQQGLAKLVLLVKFLPTKAQQRSLMCIYLRNMDGWKTRALKNKSFAEIQELFDKVIKRINNFVDFKTELVEKSTKKAQSEITQEESSKRARDELEQERSKKQKVEDDKESEELKKCLEIIPDDGDDVTIDATPYLPMDHIDSFLMHNLKTMFEHHVKDNVWKNQQGLAKVKNWKLFDSYGVHCVTIQNIIYYLLVEKMYPLTHHTMNQTFNNVKLKVDYECEMAYELLSQERGVSKISYKKGSEKVVADALTRVPNNDEEMMKMVKQWVMKCVVYQKQKRDLSAYPCLIQPLPISVTRWSEISMDFIEGLLKSQGNSVILVVVDRDKVFPSHFWKSLFEVLKVQLRMSTAYHPQTDGQFEVKPPIHFPYLARESSVEVVDRSMLAREQVLNMLKFYLKRAQDRMVSLAYRNRIDRSFEVGTWVFLKLQPRRQVTVRQGNHVCETTTTQNTTGSVQVEETLVRIINGHAGVAQVEEKPVRIIPGPAVLEDVGEDEGFKGGSWVSAVEYVNANGGGIVNGCLGDIENYIKNGKLEQVVVIIKSCTSNAIGDLTVILKDLSSTIHGTIHHKVIDRGGGNEKDITVRSALMLANVYDSIPGNGSGVGGSGMLMEEEEIVKLMEEEEMADLELRVCWNDTHQEMADEEALNLALDEEARQAQADQEQLEKC